MGTQQDRELEHLKRDAAETKRLMDEKVAPVIVDKNTKDIEALKKRLSKIEKTLD